MFYFQRMEILINTVENFNRQKQCYMSEKLLSSAHLDSLLLSYLRNVPPTKDNIRPSRKLPDPPFLGQRPGTAAAALQKRRLKPSQE